MTISSWLKFGRPASPEGVCGGAKILAPPYYSQRAVFASPTSVFFINKVLKKTKPGNERNVKKTVSDIDTAASASTTPDSSRNIAFMLKKGSLYSLAVEAEACIHRMAIIFC